MKKLILITGVFVSTSLWADMDDICSVNIEKNVGYIAMYHEEEIKAKCERNNILRVYGLDERNLISTKAIWCRFDRHISERKINRPENNQYRLTCVLYDNEPRRTIEISK